MPFALLTRLCARGHAAGRCNIAPSPGKRKPQAGLLFAVARLGSPDSIVPSPYTFFGKHALNVTPLISPPSVFAYSTPSGSMSICTTLFPSVDAPAK